ncbi:MAG: adenylate/guanylate cyclase domain-containing protein [Crocinitomicaceae bacterium]|nr:adenylate/guanylate cyclase domain-containing protein [Crocinitomicaceae bacterium]
MKRKVDFKKLIFFVVLFCNLSTVGYSQDPEKVDSLLKIIDNSSSDTTICNAYVELGRLHKKKVLDEALKYFISAEKILLKHLNEDEKPDTFYSATYADLLNNKGIIFRKFGNYSESLSCYFKAQDIFLELKDSTGISSTQFNIGAIYRYREEFNKSIEYYKKSLKIREETGEPYGLINCYNAIGIVQRKMHNRTLALEYYNKSLDLSTTIHDTNYIVQSYINIGVVYVKDSSLTEALTIFNQALELAEEMGDLDHIANCKNQIGSVYMLLQNYDLSIKYLSEALARFVQRKDLNKEMGTSIRLSRVYEAKGNYRKAFEYLERYSDLRSILKDEEETKNLVRTEMNHFFEKEKNADSITRVKEIEITDLELKGKNTQIEKDKAQKFAMYGGLFLLLIVVGVVLRSYLRKKKDNVIISEEKERSEELLLNILPKETAEELKEHGKAKARSYDLVSVLFTDFKGFTMISEILTPEELVEEIDYCYKEFDRIIGKHSIEKIKTIGDAYMCAGGLPAANDTHAKNTVDAALEIRDFMLEYKKQREQEGRQGFEIRIGIHTGPVVAGIVGIKKFAYDIWGDAVNTAARMESSGTVGKVNVSGFTYEIIKDDFDCEYRGKVPAKNKGEIDMYYVEKIKR